MPALFDPSIYSARRVRLSLGLPGGLILLPGNADSPMTFRDNIHPFRQDASFRYYFGLDQPDLVGVIDVDEDEAFLFGDELTIDDIVWTGPLPTIAERARQVDVTDTRPLAELPKLLHEARSQGRPVHYLPPYRDSQILNLARWLDRAPDEIEAGASLDLVYLVISQRAIKTPPELAELEKAVDLSVDMHVGAMRMARPGLREADLAAEVERIALAGGAGTSFPTIATIHGEILHNHDHWHELNSGDLFLLDAGGLMPSGYCGDLSSTFPVDSRFTDRQRTMYELSLAAHEAAVSTLAPGVPNLDVHLAAAEAIAEGMTALGLMRGDPEEAVAAGAHTLFFPCGVGHMLGLDVHDMESLGEVHVGWGGRPRSTEFGLKSLRLGRALEPGFVLTIEPGIYFIPELIDRRRAEGRHADFLVWDEIERWRDFGGIRNEEDFVITADGAHRLGKAKPMSLAEVEALRG